MTNSDIAKNTLPLRLHPAALIYLWLGLALVAQLLHGVWLSAFALTLVSLAWMLCRGKLVVLLRRTRMILASIFVIFAFAGSGMPLWPQLGAFSPVTDGVENGLLQIARLLGILSALPLLLGNLGVADYISGIAKLLLPLTKLGINTERLIVRLALTLQYAEHAISKPALDIAAEIGKAAEPADMPYSNVVLEHTALSWPDRLVMLAAALIIAGLWR